MSGSPIGHGPEWTAVHVHPPICAQEIADLRAKLEEAGKWSAKWHGDFLQAEARAKELEEALGAADALASCEHTSGCGAQCRCGAWEDRNAKRAEFYRLYRHIG